MAAGDLDQPACLGAPLCQAQTEMSRDEPKTSNGSAYLGFDRAARLAALVRKVMNCCTRERPAAHYHLAVIAVCGDD